MIKATYSLDLETVRLLETLASQLGVSKSEALRHAVRTAAGAGDTERRLAALDRLQSTMALSPATAAAWARDVRAERHASNRPSVRPTTEARPRLARVAEAAPKRRK